MLISILKNIFHKPHSIRLYSRLHSEPWLAWEDELLKNYVECNGRKWNEIVQHCLPNRTIIQCEARWTDFLNPILKRGPFSIEEKELLEKGITNLGQGNWTAISQHYLPHRSPRRIANEWSSTSAIKSKKRWTKQEDELLLKGIDQFGTSAWAKIAQEYLPWRTRVQIRNHYRSNLDPSVKKEKWTENELDLLLRRTIVFGQDWNRVAEGIHGRSPEQCSFVWLNELDPALNKGPWSDEETRLFWEKLYECNGNFVKVAEQLPGRNRLCCFRKFWSTVRDDKEFCLMYSDQIKRDKSENRPVWRTRMAKLVLDYLQNDTCLRQASNRSIQVHKSGPWQKEELAKLEELVHKKQLEKKHLDNNDWKSISKEFFGRDASQCKYQYGEHLFKKDIKKGSWTKEEDELLTSLIEEHGVGNWDKIVKHMPRRNKRQCTYRWHRVLQFSENDTILKRYQITDYEKSLIREGVQMYGHNWKAIHTAYLPHRTPNHIMRWWHLHEKTQGILDAPNSRKPWTEEEDDVLKFAVDKHKDDNNHIHSWAKVAKMVEGRSPEQCRARWLYSLEPTQTKGTWSYEEQMQLFEIVEKYKLQKNKGESIWPLVAKELNTGRSDWACRSKYSHMQRKGFLK